MSFTKHENGSSADIYFNYSKEKLEERAETSYCMCGFCEELKFYNVQKTTNLCWVVVGQVVWAPELLRMPPLQLYFTSHILYCFDN